MPIPQARPEVVPNPGGTPPYLLHDHNDHPIDAITEFLQELLATNCSPATVKSYVYALLDWFRYLHTRQTDWRAAARSDVRDYVLRQKAADNPYRKHRPDRPPAGSINPKTLKPSLRPGYAPATINHRLSVIHGFYDTQRHAGRYRQINPVPDTTRHGQRRYAHHHPLQPWATTTRSLYRQKMPDCLPRAISDALWVDMFAVLTTHRDRALFCLLISSAARAQEALSMTPGDVDWAGQRVRLISKGSRNAQWVSASPEFFTWLARSMAHDPPPDPIGPLWTTLRGQRRPLTYQSLRGILNRVNAKLGLNVTLHDFRHTCAIRLASDPRLSLLDVQTHLRHRHITTTQTYLRAQPDEVIRHLQALQTPPPEVEPSSKAWQYDVQDLALLRGNRGVHETKGDMDP